MAHHRWDIVVPVDGRVVIRPNRLNLRRRVDLVSDSSFESRRLTGLVGLRAEAPVDRCIER